MPETFTDSDGGRFSNATWCSVCHRKHQIPGIHQGHPSDWHLNEETAAQIADARAGKPRDETVFDFLGPQRRQRLREEELERERLESARAEQEHVAAEKAERERLEAEQAERERKEAEQAARRARAESRVASFDTVSGARSALVEAYLALDELEGRVAALEAREAR